MSNKNMRRVSHKIEQQVEHLEKLQNPTSEKTHTLTESTQNTLDKPKPNNDAKLLARTPSATSLEMPEVDFSIEVTPEMRVEYTGGADDEYESEQRSAGCHVTSMDQLGSSPTSGNDYNMSDQTIIPGPTKSAAPTDKISPQSEDLTKSPLSKHHCLLVSHVFERISLSRLRPQDKICELPPPSQRTPHHWKDLKIECDLCRDPIEDVLYHCQVKSCVREVCRGCKNGLEEERRQKAKQGSRS
jgi:hypothetical protein